MDTALPRTEVTEETRETLSVLELDRTLRPEKLRLERQYFDGAHEVRFTERTFRPKHGADLDEVRSFVDSLEVRRREIAPLPPPPKVEPMVVTPKIPDHYRAPLEKAIRGTLVSVETVHRIGTGTVVDVAWESADEGEKRGLYLITDDEAKPYTDVASKIDELPAPAAPAAPEAAPAPAPEPAPAAADAPKRKLGFGKKKEKAPEPPKVDEGPKKKRFGFGKK